MSAADLSSLGLRKELRAVLPLWAGCITAVVIGAVVENEMVLVAAGLAGTLGPAALAAQGFGHDYTYRTLGLLLSQPRERRAQLLEKYAVCVPLGFVVLGVAWWMIFRDETFMRISGWKDFPAPVYAGMCAMFIAPWLTLGARSVMGGLVFSFALPATLLVAGDVIGILIYGEQPAVVDRFNFTVFVWGTALMSVVGAVAGWRAFLRLQVVEGAGRGLHIPRVLQRSGAAARRHPLLATIGKELRLHQMGFTLVGVYLLVWIATAIVRSIVGATTSLSALRDITMVYALLMAIVFGAVPSAEERHLGTLDAQLLLPMSARRQWLVKAGTALGLALLIALAVVAMATFSLRRRGPDGFWYQFPVMIATLTSVTLYLSSLTTSTVRAVVSALPTFMLGTALLNGVIWFQRLLARTLPMHELTERFGMAVSFRTLVISADVALAFCGVGMMAVLLGGAYQNHRFVDRSWRRVCLHVAVLLGVVALWSVVSLVLVSLLEVTVLPRR
jgi:hypothetical protein